MEDKFSKTNLTLHGVELQGSIEYFSYSLIFQLKIGEKNNSSSLR